MGDFRRGAAEGVTQFVGDDITCVCEACKGRNTDDYYFVVVTEMIEIMALFDCDRLVNCQP